VIVQSTNGELYAVNPRTGATDEMAIEGRDLTSGDGLELVDDILYVVRGFGGPEVVAIELGRDGRSGTVVATLVAPSLDVPTTATFVKDRLFAVNGRFTTPATATTPYWVTQVRALR
jgi:hypothetical protein